MITKNEKILYISLFSFIILIYIYILPFDVMDIDSAQYAEISREMVENQDFFFLKDNGRKYLDKPIFTFWIISFFYKILGINNFSFRLSAFIFALLSTIGIYNITVLVYKSKRKAILSALFFISSPALFTMMLNPLIDIYLITILIFTFYFYFLGIQKNPTYFYLMYVFIGLGFITKGPISLMIPIISMGGSILITKNWELLKKLHIFRGILIIAIPVLFWSYILYLDFGIFGPYFFIYLQSFGRFFHKIYDTGFNPFYFYFTFLYCILPFSIPFLISLRWKWNQILGQKPLNEKIKAIYELINKKDISLYLWSFLVLFLLSFSRFKLPQYVFWTIPAFSIIAGNLIDSNYEKLKNLRIHFVIIFFVIFFLTGFYLYSKLSVSKFVLFIFACFIFFFVLSKDLFLVSLFSFILAYSYIASVLYPYLISFQPSSKISRILLETDPSTFLKQEYLYTYGISFSNKSYPFYSKKLTKEYLFNKENFQKDLEKNEILWIVIHEFFLESLQKEFNEKHIKIEIFERFPSLKISKPKIEYFHPQKREKHIQYVYLVKISKIK